MSDAAEQFAAERREQGYSVATFAVLGLVALREWTTYELAQQMKRSFSYFWPRAERRIYDEPKRLAKAGYVQARREVVGRRPRTCWAITPKGREALRHWLAEPVSSPTMEFEGMVKVFLSDQGSKRQLLDTLAEIRADAVRHRQHLAEMSVEVATNAGQFPERVHINALAMSYMVQVTELTARWAEESADVVREWRGTANPGEAAREHGRNDFHRLAGDGHADTSGKS